MSNAPNQLARNSSEDKLRGMPNKNNLKAGGNN